MRALHVYTFVHSIRNSDKNHLHVAQAAVAYYFCKTNLSSLPAPRHTDRFLGADGGRERRRRRRRSKERHPIERELLMELLHTLNKGILFFFPFAFSSWQKKPPRGCREPMQQGIMTPVIRGGFIFFFLATARWLVCGDEAVCKQSKGPPLSVVP